ncbi:leader peptidase (prepilin peptidase)/N-methyltransferase [Kitasatospora sp. MAP12-15]|uniref:prepilin peptidase n=1 Tax=unclassified Kitasatospora TaxID=2633591 RepID=UPI00247384BC|nr:A24 family peptidase [Kitasatospora sp. MAP12-44]MDH6112566.1 leader peptidase (prepilin peptidase)/N-methyltransferase [Kitasatospora sp. MAP12-44]
MVGLLAGLAAAPALRAAATRHAVPYGEPLRSSCACGRTLRLLPPSGRCPGCRERLGPAPLVVELVAAGVGAAVGSAVGSAVGWPIGPALVWVALFAVVLAFVDTAVHRLPDALTLPLALGTAVLLAGAALLDHRVSVLRSCLLSAVILGLLYGTLALLGPMGLGDAKLAPTLGALLAWYGWRTVFAGVFEGFLLAAVWGMTLLLTRRATRKDPLPFGPAMLLGALVAILTVVR